MMIHTSKKEKLGISSEPRQSWLMTDQEVIAQGRVSRNYLMLLTTVPTS
jgi:hypothetical protein